MHPSLSPGHKRKRAGQPPRHSAALPWLLCTAAAFGAGLLNGLLGAAGGILLVMVLPYLRVPRQLHPSGKPMGTDHERRDILATALAVMLPVSAISAVFYWAGGVRPEPSLLLLLILPAILGGLIGARLLGRISGDLIRKIFAILVIVSGVRLLL